MNNNSNAPKIEPMLTPAEVAQLFRVDTKTVIRWAVAGKLRSIRTLGGHRRFFEAEVRALLNGTEPQAARIAARTYGARYVGESSEAGS